MKARKNSMQEQMEFHTEADREKYIQKLKDDYEDQKSGVLYDTVEIIKYLNVSDDHEPHPALGSAEIVFGGVSFMLQVMNTELDLAQLPYLVGAALVAAAGANNLDDKSKYRGPFITILSVAASPLILAGVSISKLRETIKYKKRLNEAKNHKLDLTLEEQLELEKEEFSKNIQASIDSINQSASQELESVITEVKDLETLILDICSPFEAERYIESLTNTIEILFDEYKWGYMEAKDLLEEFKKRTAKLRNQAERTKLDEYMEDESVPAFKNPMFLELTQKHLERQTKEAN